MKVTRCSMFASLAVLMAAALIACQNPIALLRGSGTSESATGQGVVLIRIQPISPVVVDAVSKNGGLPAKNLATPRAFLAAGKVWIQLRGDQGTVEWTQSLDPTVTIDPTGQAPAPVISSRTVPAGTYSISLAVYNSAGDNTPTLSGSAGGIVVNANGTKNVTISCVPYEAIPLQIGIASDPIQLAVPWQATTDSDGNLTSMTAGSEQWYRIAIEDTTPKTVTVQAEPSGHANLAAFVSDPGGTFVAGGSNLGATIAMSFDPTQAGPGTYYIGVVDVEANGVASNGPFMVRVEDAVPPGPSTTLTEAWTTENASALYGYRDLDGSSVGDGQAVTYASAYSPTSFAIKLTGPFYKTDDNTSGYAAPLELRAWNSSDGSLLGSASLTVPSTFAGGWITFDLSGSDIQVPAGATVVYATYVKDAATNHLQSSIAGDQDDGYNGATDTRWSAVRTPATDLDSYSYWGTIGWDLDFKLQGTLPVFAKSSITENASSWYGYRDLDGYIVGSGQTVTYPSAYSPSSFSIKLGGAFYKTDDNTTGHDAVLRLRVWNTSSGVLLGSASATVPGTFGGGWVTFDLSGSGVSVPAGATVLYATFLTNAETNHLANGNMGDANEGYGGSTDTRWSSVQTASANMDAYSSWFSDSWDLVFNLWGIRD